jgi:hypothetical protein
VRFVALTVALSLFAAGCAPGLAGQIPNLKDPAPSTEAPAAHPSTLECPPRPVTARFKFAAETLPEDRRIIRDAVAKARGYFPLRYPRAARWSYAEERELCYPAAYAEVVVTTFDQPEGNEVAWYRWGRGMRFYVGIEGWRLSPAYFKYLVAFHEAYHWFQHLRGKTYQGSGTGQLRRPEPFWLVEGAAEWGAYEALAHFDLYPGMDAARQEQASIVAHDRSELKSFETRSEDYAAYALFFQAVDRLVQRHGGRAALTKYWSFTNDDIGWREYFQDAFGISVKRFYKEFAASA